MRRSGSDFRRGVREAGGELDGRYGDSGGNRVDGDHLEHGAE